MKFGKLIVLEGLDGSGKSTQAQAIRDYLESKGQPCIVVSDPGGTPFGDYIRTYVKDPDSEMSPGAEAFAFASACRESLEQVVIPALEQGVSVIYDRFIWSRRAYQGAGLGLMALVRQLETTTLTTLPFTEPALRARPELVDLVLYLKSTPELALKRRVAASGTDRIEKRGLEYYKKVSDQFDFDLSDIREPHRADWTVVIDATKDVNFVTAACLNVIDEIL